MAWQGSRWHFRNLDVPVDDLVALSRRVAESFAGRCVRRFLAMSGIDRCIVLSSQAFTALIPLLILVSTLAPVGQEDVIARSVITKFGLTGDTADAVHQLFKTPEGPRAVSVSSARCCCCSPASRSPGGCKRCTGPRGNGHVRVRAAGSSPPSDSLTLLAEVFVLYVVRSLARHLPLDGW